MKRTKSIGTFTMALYIYTKDSIDLNIKQSEIHPDKINQIIVFIKGYKMKVCIMIILDRNVFTG